MQGSARQLVVQLERPQAAWWARRSEPMSVAPSEAWVETSVQRQARQLVLTWVRVSEVTSARPWVAMSERPPAAQSGHS
jgi:hypothetical protein